MIPRAEYPADVHNATDSNGGEGVVVDVAAAVPVTFVAILIIVLITTWVIPVCRGKKKSHEQRRSERLEKLDKAVKSELFMDYTKKERQKHSGDPYDTVLCVICLEQFEDASQIRGLECSHVFHQACVDDWFSRYNEYCPLCHRPIIPGSVSQTPHTLDHRYERPGLTFIV